MLRWRSAVRAIGVALLLSAPSPVQAQETAQAQETVQVRAGAHADYGRLVFDWAEPVRYRAFVEEGRLHLEFARKAAFGLAAVQPALDGYIGRGAPGPHGYRLTFPLKGDFELKHWTSGPKVVVDLKGSPDASSGGPTVRMRVGRHEDFDRLVFDWPRPVDYTLSRDGPQRASIRFRQPARIDFGSLQRVRPERVSSMQRLQQGEGEGAGIAIAIPARARLRDFTDGPKVVVDVMDPAEPGDPATAAEQAAESEAAAARAVPTPPSPPERKPDPGAPKPAVKPGPSTTAADQPLRLLPDARAAVARADNARAAKAGSSAAQAASEAGPEAAPPRGDDGAAGGGAISDAAGDAERGGGVRTHRVPPGERFPPQRVARGIAPRPGQVPPPLASTTIDLPWATGRGAVFQRGGAVWFVAEGTVPENFAAELAAEGAALDGVRTMSLDKGSAVRLVTRPGLRARPLFEAGRWRLSLADHPALPDRPLEHRVRDGRLILLVKGAGPVITLDDPGGGGRLLVVPLPAQGAGLAFRREFPEFTLLATATGIAVVPKSERVRVHAEPSQVVIDGGASGLALSGRARGPGGAKSPLARRDGRRLLDLVAWRREARSYSRARQDLQQAIVQAPPARRDLARLRLARFYFAHGLEQEALGALRVYTKDAPRRRRDPQVRLMIGAAHLLAGDWRKAGEALAHPALDGVPEAMLWRAAHAAMSGADRAAVNAFHRSEALLDDYPDTVRKRMQLWIADARLRLGETGAAERHLAAARALQPNRAEQAEIDYLTARRHLIEGDVAAAEGLWREVGDGAHPPTRARARLVMVERDLAADRIDRPEAVARLERLRFAWRGDAFEGVLLHRLADFYAAGDDYRRSLKALRQAAAHLPGTPWARRATARMRGIFKDRFLNEKADRMPALKALALYESFRELTPAGPDGDRMIARLVDRLVRVDLLERAAKLLDGQVRHRLEGVARARAGARLASILLLDRKPEQALQALDLSRAVGGSKALADRRRQLRARALGKLDRPESALALLEGDDSPDGLRLRADIHADTGEWSKAAEALRGLLPPAPAKDGAFDDAQARRVLRAAVAMTLAGQTAGLDRLDARYGAAMAGSRHAQAFRMLSGDSGGNGVHTIAQRLAQVDHATAFMNSFRDSLQQQASLADEG